MGILIYLVLFWAVTHIYREFLSGKAQKLRRRLKHMHSHLHDRCRWDRDRLTEKQSSQLEELAEQALALHKEKPSIKDMQAFLNKSHKAYEKMYPKKRFHGVRDFIELLVVVFGVVMGIRALFLQPFKIPTGSMQPTLYGIHFDAAEDPQPAPGLVAGAFRFLNYSSRYVDVTIKKDCTIIGGEAFNQLPSHPSALIGIGSFRFLESTDLKLCGETYTFPGTKETVGRRIFGLDSHQPVRVLKTGEQINGSLLMGDHLFVDRLRYNFMEPKRGDIVVFTTEGIRYAGGRRLAGLHYIKRLVGMPGDSLRIQNRKLYVKQPGKTTWELVDGSFHEAFERMYSFKGGYRGYSHPSVRQDAQYLLTNDDVFTLGDDEYFMLGDNSENSADSRYWGVVPRENILGCALWIWWPFSRRWGPVDRVDPEPYPSPPTSPAPVPLPEDRESTIELQL